jgi:Domain of unknown function (DUF6438)/Ankyrin repeats (3 copies)/Ankyrin repeat
MRFDTKRAALALILGMAAPAIAQQDRAVITLERLSCFNGCPVYLLSIDSSGAVSFKRGVPANRREEQRSTISPDQFQALVAEFEKLHFFELNDVYTQGGEDAPKAYIGLTLNGKTKRILTDPDYPQDLAELERTVERAVNVHRWLHGVPERFTLQSSVESPFAEKGEDLKNESGVRQDIYACIKPGMNRLMQAAGKGDVDAIRRALKSGDNLNAADETGWTALMLAAVAVQPRSVSTLLDAGAQVNQRDHHGDTALIGAASIRFRNLGTASEILRDLLAHGAWVEATNNLGESALMWAARAGSPGSIQVLLDAGADPARVDQSGHDALFYLRKARDGLSFDKDLVERYNQAELVLKGRKPEPG